MKISIIGPGIMPIPPIGWGAVESLIWDYSRELKKLGIEVQIVNTTDRREIINLVNSFNPDFVHLQYDDFYDVLSYIECKNKAATSHYGYLESESHLRGGYFNIFRGFVEGDFNIFCLSDRIKDVYLKNGVVESRLYVTPNGASYDLFKFREIPKYPDRSIYLAKVTDRKKQYLYQDIDFIDFAGNLDDYRFNPNRGNYLGEWEKSYLYENLSDYSNLVLLSDGEAHPLVCCEALICGLGLVISESSSANLDLDLPYIEVIKNSDLDNIDYIKEKIRKNQKISNERRKEIRKYGLENFSWEHTVTKYLEKISRSIKK
jgi:glycosyltransferase involved in cell wall biosynthesis